MNQQVETEKWYRIPMVWLMIGLPMLAVVIAYKNAPQVISAPSSTSGDSNH